MTLSKRLLRPVGHHYFFWLFTLLLSVPGIIYVFLSFRHIPLYRAIAWSCYISVWPALMAYLLSLSRRRTVRLIAYAIGLVFFAVNLFLVLNFGTVVSPSVLLLCIETTGSEASEFIRHYGLTRASLSCYVSVLVALIAIVLAERQAKGGRHLVGRWVGRLLLVAIPCWFVGAIVHTVSMCYMLTCHSQYDMERWYGRIGLYDTGDALSSVLYSVHHLSLLRSDNRHAIDTNLQASTEEAFCTDADSLQVVLVIGESYNKHHSQLYGYQLPTTPYQLEECQQGNLLVFTNVVAPYNMTSMVMKNLLSTNSLSLGQSWADYPIFPVIFRRAGFHVAFWDNQKVTGTAGFHDLAICSFLYHSQLVPIAYNQMNSEIFDYDHQLFDDYVAHHAHPCSRHQLAIFHLMGQHSYAKYRVPDEERYRVFKASDIPRIDLGESQRQSVADYDNATRYNDLLMHLLYSHYRHQDAVVVYLSDHGEEVFDYRNFMGRSHEREKTADAMRYQYEVPFTIWCSKRFMERRPRLVDSFRQAVNRHLTTDDVPHLLFHLSSISTPYYNKERDILRW